MKHTVGKVIELYERNYKRLLLMIPALDRIEAEVDLTVDGMGGLVFCVLEHCKYTSIVELSNNDKNDARFGTSMTMRLRVYYDAQVAEVISYQGCGRLRSRYNYPNKTMFMPREKLQVNQFLAEWLEHCLLLSYEPNCLTVSPRS